MNISQRHKENAIDVANRSKGGLTGLHVRVQRVIDGDTLIVKPSSPWIGEFVVRLAYVDTPELHIGESGRAAPYAREAARFTYSSVVDMDCYLDSTDGLLNLDPYKRIVGVLTVDRSGDASFSFNLNEELLLRGYALVYWRRTVVRCYDQFVHYLRAEKYARKHRLGLWRRRSKLVVVLPGGSVYHSLQCHRIPKRAARNGDYLRRTVYWARSHGLKPCSYCMK